MDLTAFFKQYNPSLKDITIKNYIGRLNILFKAVKTAKAIRSLRFLYLDVGDVVKFIDTNYTNPESKSSYFSVAYQTLDLLIKKASNKKIVEAREVYYKMAMKQREILNCKTKDNIASEKQNKNYVKYEKLLEYAKTINNPMLKFIAIFHLYFPLRNELRTIKLITVAKWDKLSNTAKKDDNWIIIDDNKYTMILNKYKTDNIYGEKVIELDKKDVKTALKNHISTYPTFDDNPYLLYGVKGNPLTTPNYTKYVAKAFKGLGKQITSTILRHIVITHQCGKETAEMKKNADIACHSVSTHMNYVKKYC